jgi:hypothetical protein
MSTYITMGKHPTKYSTQLLYSNLQTFQYNGKTLEKQHTAKILKTIPKEQVVGNLHEIHAAVEFDIALEGSLVNCLADIQVI